MRLARTLIAPVVALLTLLSLLTIQTSTASATAPPPDGTYSCQTGMQSSVGSTFTITSGVVTANSHCGGHVVIPDGVVGLGNQAFYGDTLTSITIPTSVTSIGLQAFTFASLLTTINIPSSVTTIDAQAFLASGLVSVTIPVSVTSIGDFAFLSAHSLSSLTIPTSVTSIGNSAFLDTPALSEYIYCGNLSSASLNSAGLTGKTKLCTPGSPLNLSATATGSTSASLTFTAPTSNGGVTIDRYDVKACVGMTCSIVASPTTAGSVTLTGLAPSTNYTFVASAHNLVGSSDESLPSNAISTYSLGSTSTFSGVTSLENRFKVQIANYDPTFSYVLASTAGQASIDSYGLITVNGLDVYQSATITITKTKAGYEPGVSTVTGRSLPAPVPPMIPIDKPKISVTASSISCSMGNYSATPTSSVFSLFVDGVHISTIFSAVGDYLPDWLIPWATPGTISRTATLTSASWTTSDGYKGKSITCATLAYSNHATGTTTSDEMVMR